MYLVNSSAAQPSGAGFDDTSVYHTQFEFMSVGERLRRINLRIKNSTNKNSTQEDDQIERCAMVHFSVDDKSVTEARHLIISLCKEKLIFLRIKPVRHSTVMQMEMFVKESMAQRVKELLKLRFQS